MAPESSTTKLKQIVHLLGEVAILLISNGSNTRRVSRNVTRIANALGCDFNIFYSYSAVVLTVTDTKTKESVTEVRTISENKVHFAIVTDISILSWQVVEHNLSPEEINKEIEQIKKHPRYNKYIMFLFVAIAGGSLARIFGGSYWDFLISFTATFTGLFVKNYFLVRKYNGFIITLFAAFVSVTVVNLFRITGFTTLNAGLAASVLWLIPGVPLINGFIDLLSGYIVPGMAKLTSAIIFVFMIALGFFLSLIIFGYGATL